MLELMLIAIQLFMSLVNLSLLILVISNYSKRDEDQESSYEFINSSLSKLSVQIHNLKDSDH